MQQLPPHVRAVLQDRRLRLAFTWVVALAWYFLVIAGEAGRAVGPAAIVGVPAMAVLFWWRVRPLRALGLASLAVAAIAVSSWWVWPGQGAFALAASSVFAILGAAMSEDLRVRLVGALLTVVGSVTVLIVWGSYGAGSFLLLLLLLLLGAIAIAIGWGWRQLRASGFLRVQLVETAQRGEAAEQDVLVELERNRLAREVHDVVAHSLAVVIAQADGARFAAETKPETVAPALEAISDTARRALGEVRTMLHDLRTSGEGGVVPGADDLTGLVEGVRGLGVEVEEVAYGEAQALTRTAGLALYRVAQEALTNAMRHGDRAEPVGFEIDWGAREVVLVVTNAVPTEAVPASERAGHGVTGMRERAADAGGDCSAGIGSNGRFRVRVALPIEAEPAPAAVAEQPANPLLALFAQAAPQSRA